MLGRSSLFAAVALAMASGGGALAFPGAKPLRYYRQRGHAGVGTKAYQRAALKARRRKEAHRA